MNRLNALSHTGLMDSPAEEVFDRMTKLVQASLDVPIALVSLVDDTRQFFKSQVGLTGPAGDERQTPLTHSFCKHVAGSSEPLVVSDATADALVFDNCAVGDLNVMAYAGMPLTDSQGNTLGALCAIDTEPRFWTVRELEILQTVAAQVMVEIERRVRATRMNELASAPASEDGQSDAQKQAYQEACQRLTAELQTPLASMLMSMQVVASSGVLNREQRQYLALAEQNGRLLRSLHRDLQYVGQPAVNGSHLNLGEVSINSVVSEMIEQSRPLAEARGLQLESSVSESLPQVRADGAKLKRMLINLISNAIKFTPKGGTVTVIAKQNDDQVIELIVEDSGVGIAEADLHVIFEEGVSLKNQPNQTAGAGFGLTQSRDILRAHGGEVTCESVPHKGSRFICKLPLQPDLDAA